MKNPFFESTCEYLIKDTFTITTKSHLNNLNQIDNFESLPSNYDKFELMNKL